MSWWRDHDPDLDLSPRRGPPAGHRISSVAKVRPLVPEITFYPTKPGGGLEEALPGVADPARGAAQVQGAATMPTSVVPEPRRDPNREGQLLEMLARQNEQILRLQEQMQALLLERERGDGRLERRRPEADASTCAPERSSQGTQHSFSSPEVGVSIAARQPQPAVTSASAASAWDAATQTSPPSSPRRIELRSPLQTAEISSSSRARADQSCEADQREGSSLQLGESASMYAHVEDGDCAAHPSPTECDEIIRKLEGSAKLSRSPERTAEDANIDRFRQMGVSFISPEDLRGGGGIGRRRTRSPEPFETLYQPRLDLSPPSFASSSATPSINTQESLDANSTALKCLDDDALSRLAGAGRTSGRGRLAVAPAAEAANLGVTRYGLPEAHLSVATKRFLMMNDLVSNRGEGDKRRDYY